MGAVKLAARPSRVASTLFEPLEILRDSNQVSVTEASAFEMEDLDVRLMQLEEAESRRQKRPH